MSSAGQGGSPFRGFSAMFNNWGSSGKPATEKPVDGNPQNPAGGKLADTNNNTNPDSDADSKLLNDVWNENKPDTSGDNKQQQQNNNPQNPQQPDPEAMLAKHLKDRGLEPFSLSEQEIEALKSGEGFQDLIGKINTRTTAAYMSAMKDSNALIQEQVKKALADAKQDTNTTLQGIELRNFLVGGIPYIKDDNILGPVAETAFKSFYEKTKGDKERSLKLTKEFLAKTADTVNNNDPDRRDQIRGSFRGAPQASDAGTTDWLGMLQGKSGS